jgi:hypothetical protein
VAKRGKALFKSICLGKCKSRDLPARLNLSAIAPEMNRLWEASIREIESGVVREHAALLVWERERLRLTNVVEGTEDDVEPDYRLATGQQFVGTFHTHPYATGLMGMAFSGADIATALFYHERLSVVQSGDLVVAMARTELTPKFFDTGAIERSAKALFENYRRIFPLQAAVLKMNRSLCEQHKLGFYGGDISGQLHLEFRP